MKHAIDVKKYARYEMLFGALECCSDDMMGFMDSGYDNRTLKQVTENCSAIEFVAEIFTILSIGRPSLHLLAASLGIFIKSNDNFVSDQVFNKQISKIMLCPVKNTENKGVFARIVLSFSDVVFSVTDILELVQSHNFNIIAQDDMHLTISREVIKNSSPQVSRITGRIGMKQGNVYEIDMSYD